VVTAAAATLHCPLQEIYFTSPAMREKEMNFTDNDLVFCGTPTYAGRVPNKIAPYIAEKIRGCGAAAAAVGTFGNRNYDNALAELCALLEADGFHTLSAAAFACRHAFTDALAAGRPDREDLAQAADFGSRTAARARELTAPPAPVQVPGDPAAPYYVPRGLDGEPAKFLKARPRTDLSRCSSCGVCARVCPMGAIDPKNVSEVPGLCIKCQACVRRCTRHAKYFDDPAFLSHVAMLERNFAEPKKDEMFL